MSGRAAAAAVCLTLAAAASAQSVATEDAARRALAHGEYAKVVALYEPEIASGAALSDLAHYRLAIAHIRLRAEQDSPRKAQRHLQAALAINPQGSFASSPERLRALREEIHAECQRLAPPGCTEPQHPAQEPTVAPAVAASSSTPAPAPAQPPAPATNPASFAAAPSPAAASAAQSGGLHQPPAADAAARQWMVAAAIAGSLALLAAALAGLLWYRSVRRHRPEVASLVEMRNRTAQLLATFEAVGGGRQTELYTALADLLPLLEREIGRSAWRAGKGEERLIEADRKAVEAVRRLSRKPLDVMTATPQEIALLFQRPVM